MHIFEPINLAPQPFLQSIMDSTPWPDRIKPALVEQVKEILFALGWPMAIMPNMLLARMPAGWSSDIHKDTNSLTQALHQTVINIPVAGQHYMEWFEQLGPDPVAPTLTPGWRHSIPWLDPLEARISADSRACGLAYLCNSGQWHRVVNGGETPALVVSIRYASWSHLPWDQALAHTPWVNELRHR